MSYFKSVFFTFAILVAFCNNTFSQLPAYGSALKTADSLYRLKTYEQAAIAYSKASALIAHSNPSDIYNEACAWALANEPDSALKKLNTIVGINYFNYNQLATDADLVSLRKDKRWKQMMNRITKTKLSVFKKDQLNQDFDQLISALKEAHTGLYWYNSYPAFDSICTAQRSKIKSGMNEADFFQIVAPVVAFTKEGHTYLRMGEKAQSYFSFSAKYFPVYLKFLDQKPFIINDINGIKLKGMILSKINGVPMSEMMQKFLEYEPSDGFNITSKYRWIEENAKFSRYYAYAYPQTADFTIEVIDPLTQQKNIYAHIKAIDYRSFYNGYKDVINKIPKANDTLPADLSIDNSSKTATLTFNTFSSREYEAKKIDFHEYVKAAFKKISESQVTNLVIDIRKNGGGDEGFEDYVLSFLINKDYHKYQYVQASAFAYSFYANSDYKYDWTKLERMLKGEHILEKDGRILRKAGIEEHEKPQANPYLGNIYVLTSGLTYSGGSEFATLLKNYTKALFVGEEVGGGYYGNTSGNRIVLKLPNTQLNIGIPILKFVLSTPIDSNPIGHGVLPDYYVQPTISQFLEGYDAEMEYVKKMIDTAERK